MISDVVGGGSKNNLIAVWSSRLRLEAERLRLEDVAGGVSGCMVVGVSVGVVGGVVGGVAACVVGGVDKKK